ncbi:MAG TPA: HEAT repeat domain-containing protein [Candidatus Eremiobacteraceae bacterium]
MNPSLVSLEQLLVGLEISLVVLLTCMFAMRTLRVRRAEIAARARAWMVDKMLPLFDGDAEQRCEGRKVYIDDVLVVELPPPKGILGDAVREVFADHLIFIAGELRERLVKILEEAGYISAAMRGLKSRNVESRIKTCMLLGAMHSRLAVPALIEVFGDDPDAFVRIGAAEALGAIGSDVAVAPLLAALRNPTRWQQVRVAEVLSRMGMTAVPALTIAVEDKDIRIAALALDILADIGWMSDFGPAERALKHESPEVRARAAEALGRGGATDRIASLFAASTDAAWFVRVRVMKALHALGAPLDDALSTRFFQVLDAGLHDDVWWVRRHAAEALADSGELGRTILGRAMLEPVGSIARRAAVSALQRLVLLSASRLARAPVPNRA